MQQPRFDLVSKRELLSLLFASRLSHCNGPNWHQNYAAGSESCGRSFCRPTHSRPSSTCAQWSPSICTTYPAMNRGRMVRSPWRFSSRSAAQCSALKSEFWSSYRPDKSSRSVISAVPIFHRRCACVFRFTVHTRAASPPDERFSVKMAVNVKLTQTNVLELHRDLSVRNMVRLKPSIWVGAKCVNISWTNCYFYFWPMRALRRCRYINLFSVYIINIKITVSVNNADLQYKMQRVRILLTETFIFILIMCWE